MVGRSICFGRRGIVDSLYLLNEGIFYSNFFANIEQYQFVMSLRHKKYLYKDRIAINRRVE